MSGSFQEEVLEFLKLHNEGYTEEQLRATGNRKLLLELLPERKNLIHWIPFANKRVLQVGAGVGTLTVELLRSGATVDVIEADTASAAVILERLSNEERLSVTTDAEAFLASCEEHYDWILLEEGMMSGTVRRLAKASKNTSSKEALSGLLQRLGSYLSEQGRILFVNDNRMGMKYFSSTNQERTPYGEFVGDYGEEGQTRFTYKELQQVFADAGLGASFYYTVPDAIFTEHIYSERHMPDGEDFFHDAMVKNGGNRLFHEDGAFMTALQEDLFREFANTYLCILQPGEADCSDLASYVKYSTRRKSAFAISTEVYEPVEAPRFVRKRAFLPEGCDHIQNILALQRDLSGALANTKFYPCMCHSTQDATQVVFDYAPGESLEHMLDGYLFSGAIDKAYALMENFFEELSRGATKEFYLMPEFTEIFLGEIRWPNLADVTLSVTDVDLIFANVICDNNKWWIIDYEWSFRFPIPFRFLMFRCLFYYLHAKPKRMELLGEEVYRHFGFEERELDLYHQMEEHFQDYIYGGHKPLYVEDGCVGEVAVTGEDGPFGANVYADCGEGFLPQNRIEVHPVTTASGTAFSIPVEPQVRWLRIEPAGFAGILSGVKAQDEAGENLFVSCDYEKKIDGETYLFLEEPAAFTVGLLPGSKEVMVEYTYDALVNFDAACGVTCAYETQDAARIRRLRSAFGMKKQKQARLIDLSSDVLDVAVDGYTIRGTEDLIMGYALATEQVGITVTDKNGTKIPVSIRRVVRSDVNRKYRNVAMDEKSGYIVSMEQDEEYKFPLTVQFNAAMMSKQVKISKRDAARGMRPSKGQRIANRFHKGIQLLGEEGLSAVLARLGDKRAKKQWEKRYRSLEG